MIDLMKLIWKPCWYNLDQEIVVGLTDSFYINSDKSAFTTELSDEDEYEIRAKIIKIEHPSLGEIKGVVFLGLDYKVFLVTGESITVNSEEYPGQVFGSDFKVDDWTLKVTVKVLEEIGMTQKHKLGKTSAKELKQLREQREELYKRLLGTDDLDG